MRGITCNMEPLLVKNKENVPCSRPISKIPQFSKIPVPAVVSKIPVRGQKSKKNPSPKFSVLDRKPKNTSTIIKPVITKRNSIHFKEFNLTKAGTKPVVKRKSIGKAKTQKPLQKAIVPFPGRFSNTKKRENTTAGFKKDNFLVANDNKASWECKSLIKSDNKTLKEMQEELNAAFEPSEFYKNQILNNKEITLSQLGYITPLKDKRNSRDAAEIALERIQRWSTCKKSKVSNEKENFCSTPSAKVDLQFSGKKDVHQNMSDSFTRRSTWAPGSSPLSKVDPYEAAMARIKRMSISKAQSPTVQKLKEGGAALTARSPIKMSAYDIAMQQLNSLKKKSKVIKPVPEIRNSEVEIVQEKKEESSPVKDNLKIAFANLSPKNAFKAKPGYIYRPLQNLQTLTLSPVRPLIQKHRLTDISEHSENESTSTLSRCSLGFGRFNRSSISESSTRDNTPQNTMDGASFPSFRLPIAKSLVDQCSQNVESTPRPPQPIAKVNFTAVTTTATLSTSKIHMPVPVSAYTSKPVHSPIGLFEETGMSCAESDIVPIHTPMLLKRMAKVLKADLEDSHVNELASVKQSLDFQQMDSTSNNNDTEMKWEPRYSNYTKHIPTKVKAEEILADQEVALILSRQETDYSQCRETPVNPLSVILSKGDLMHFVPINREVPVL